MSMLASSATSHCGTISEPGFDGELLSRHLGWLVNARLTTFAVHRLSDTVGDGQFAGNTGYQNALTGKKNP
ncbi:hypothetical protein ACLB1Q_07270 [Escherichia coli]